MDDQFGELMKIFKRNATVRRVKLRSTDENIVYFTVFLDPDLDFFKDIKTGFEVYGDTASKAAENFENKIKRIWDGSEEDPYWRRWVLNKVVEIGDSIFPQSFVKRYERYVESAP